MLLGIKFKPKRFADDEIAVCIETYFTAERHDPVRQGRTFKGSDPLVRAHPQFFAPADATTADIHSQRQAVVFAPMNEQAEAADRVMREEQAKNQAPPIPEEKRVIATATFRAGGRSFATGQIYSLDDEVVKKNKVFFAWPPRPLT